MTAPAPQSQPEAAAPYQHVCPDVDCCYHGQPSFRGCGCYRTREQMMSARIEELTKALREISDLYVNAPGWAAPEPSHAREYKMHQIARSALSLEDRK